MNNSNTVKTFKTEEAARQWACRYVRVCFGTFQDARISLALVGFDLVISSK